MDVMKLTKEDFSKELKKKVLAGKKILLVDIMNLFSPGKWRVEVYTQDDAYRGFFKFSSEEWPPTSPYGEGEPDLEYNDRDCGIQLDLNEKVQIEEDHLLYKSTILSCNSSHNPPKETFKLYFIEDKPINISEAFFERINLI